MEPAIGIIQARLSSQRLPGKVLKELAGYPIIWHIYKRLARCRYIDNIIVATSNDESDDPLVEFCQENQMNVFRGSLTNVMERFTKILHESKYKYFARITGDCPLIHPDFIDHQIIALNQFDGDLVWIPNPGTLFEGQGVHSSRSLFHIAGKSIDKLDSEHVGSEYLANHPQEFKIVKFEIPSILVFSDIRITVDEPEDYQFFQELYNALWKGQPIELLEVIDFLEKNPQIKRINQGVKHKKYNLQVMEKKRKNRPPNLVGSYNYTGN